MSDLKIDFVPARWWDALDYFRLTLEMVRGRDPLADQLLARPWSLRSLLEFGYLLDNFFHASTFFVVVSGERAGVISMRHYPQFIYMDALGVLPEFQRGDIGRRIGKFIRDYGIRRKYHWGVAAMAVSNKPVHMLCGAFGGRLLGLSTTKLTLGLSISMPSEFEMKRLKRSEAREAWKRWKLDEVKHVAGEGVVEIAAQLLGTLPRGEYLALYQKGQEIGFALARRQKGEVGIDLYTSTQFWSSESTAGFVAALAHHLGSTARYLQVTQTHANTLTASASFDFRRHREEERHFVYFTSD